MTSDASNESESSPQGFQMKKYVSLFGLTLTLIAATGCDSSSSELITPDEEFYAKGLAAEQNGVPPTAAPGPSGKRSPAPSDGPSAYSP